MSGDFGLLLLPCSPLSATASLSDAGAGFGAAVFFFFFAPEKSFILAREKRAIYVKVAEAPLRVAHIPSVMDGQIIGDTRPDTLFSYSPAYDILEPTAPLLASAGTRNILVVLLPC